MAENIFKTDYDVTKKSKAKIFFDKYKKVIYFLIVLFIISTFSIFFYIDYKEDKKKLFSENYIKAKIYLENKKNNQALQILHDLALSNDSVYSSLALFLILEENLITDPKKVAGLFDQVLDKSDFNDDIKNLIIFKKVIFKSNYANESELLDEIKPLIKSDSIWKAHALLFMGDFFASKKNYLQSKNFYNQILEIKNLHKDFYYKVNSKLALISNEQ